MVSLDDLLLQTPNPTIDELALATLAALTFIKHLVHPHMSLQMPLKSGTPFQNISPQESEVDEKLSSVPSVYIVEVAIVWGGHARNG